MSTYDPMSHAAAQDVQDALVECEQAHHAALREAHQKIVEAHDRLRQRLQVVAMGGDPGPEEGNAD